MSTEFAKRISEEYIGWWFRAGSYVVKGNHVQASDGAEIDRYNPWDGFVIADGTGHRGGGILHRPYISLIELSDTFAAADKTRGGFAHLDPKMHEVFQQWHQQHGSLGLFLVTARQVNLYPRWESIKLSASSPKNLRFPSFSRHIRTPTGWRTQLQQSLSNVDAFSLDDSQKPEGGLLPANLWGAGWRTGVLTQSREGFTEETMQSFMSRFFPSVPIDEQETFQYPIPLSESFWKLYCESTADILNAAGSFAKSVRALARFRPVDEMNEVEHHFIAAAYHELMYLASQVNPSLTLNRNGTCSQEWVCTSLLASYAMMVLLDMERGALNLCTNCNKVFASSAGRARFCSQKCRRTQLQRESRARKKS